MFKELAPYLRQRAVLLTVTHLEEDDQIRVNIIPKKLKDGENNALTTPRTVTGTAEELDRDLPSTIVGFVSAHLQLRNTLQKAQEEMDVAAKAAKAEAAAAKTKVIPKKDAGKPDTTAKAESTQKPAVPAKPESPKTASLFDVQQPAAPAPTGTGNCSAEEEEILAEAGRSDEQEEDEDLDQAA